MVFEVALRREANTDRPWIGRRCVRRAWFRRKRSGSGFAVPTLTWIPGLMRRPRRGQVGDGGRAGCGSVLEYLRVNEEAC